MVPGYQTLLKFADVPRMPWRLHWHARHAALVSLAGASVAIWIWQQETLCTNVCNQLKHMRVKRCEAALAG
eukprot:402583-Rhodomonas_salina.1